jgi:hypothetical protein
MLDTVYYALAIVLVPCQWLASCICAQKIRLFASEDSSALEIVQKYCPSLTGDRAKYVPPFWMASGHLQTVRGLVIQSLDRHGAESYYYYYLAALDLCCLCRFFKSRQGRIREVRRPTDSSDVQVVRKLI